MEVDSVAGAARRQRERRLRQFLRRERLSDPMALAEFVHHSAPRGQRMARAGGGEEEEREENEQSEAPRRQSTMYFRMDEGVGRRFCWNQALDVLVLQMMEVVDVSQERGALRDVAVLSERVSERTVDMHVPQERELQRTLEQMPVSWCTARSSRTRVATRTQQRTEDTPRASGFRVASGRGRSCPPWAYGSIGTCFRED